MKRRSRRKCLITAQKFLDFAKRILSKKSAPEEELRSAVSRAYYSLFHETGDRIRKRYSHALIKRLRRGRRLNPTERMLLNRLDPKFLRKFNLHRAYPDVLIDLGFRPLAISLKQSRISRNQADYDLGRNFNRKDTTIIVNSMDRLISQIRSA